MTTLTGDRLDLFRRWRDHQDLAAREELVHRHLTLARKVARRYSHTQEPFDDLFQIASLGLVKAIDRFDPDRGLAFSSFAVPTMLGEIKRHFRDKGWSVHVPRGLQELALKVKDAQIKLGSRAQRPPTVADIAQYLETSIEDVLEALEVLAAHHATSLDAPVGAADDEDTMTRLDTLGRDDEQFDLIDASMTITGALSELSESDRNIFSLRYDDELTQQQIAQRIGVSQMQVSRILRRITNQLRETIEIDEAAPGTRRTGAPNSAAAR